MSKEILKTNSNGQWSIEKSNSVKPFGENIYDEKANINRKANRTGEVAEGFGGNSAVKQYQSTGASMQAASEKATAKAQKKKSKASLRTLEDMTPEEQEEIRRKYALPLAQSIAPPESLSKGADVAREALTTGHLPLLAPTPLQPTDEQMFGHLVSSPIQKPAATNWAAELGKNVDSFAKDSPAASMVWKPGTSFNSLLTPQELAKRNGFNSGNENE